MTTSNNLPISHRATRGFLSAFQMALLALPVVMLYRAVRACRFNTLFLDDWVYVPLYEKAVKGGLTLHDLFAGYLEHRIPIPKILAILGVIFTKGDVTTQNGVAFAALTVSWLGAGLLLRRALGSWERMWLPWALSAWALCSAVHWQVLLMPSMHLLALPGFFLVMGLLALGSDRLGFWPKLALTFLAACCGMLSCASGLTLAILLPAAALCGYGMRDQRMARRFFGILSSGMVIVIALYLHDLKSEVDSAFAYGQENGTDTLKHDVSALLLANPGRGVPFFIAQLGTNLCRGVNADRRITALVMGGLLLMCYLGFLIWAWRGRKEGILTKAAPFLALGGYSIGSAMMITLGRAWASTSFGGALNNRYSAIAALLEVSLVCLGALLWRTNEAKTDLRQARMPLTLATGALAMLLLVNWCHGRQMMTAWQASMIRGAVDIHFSQLLGLAGGTGREGVHLQITQAIKWAKTLDELGYLRRPLAKDLRLSQFKRSQDMPHSQGDIEAKFLKATKVHIQGYALLKSAGRAADGILVTTRPLAQTDAEPMIVDVGFSDELPSWLDVNFTKDYHFILKNPDRAKRFGEWQLDLERSKIPPGKQKIECWALDFITGTVRKIGDGFNIEGD